jgi:hypothetical protein
VAILTNLTAFHRIIWVYQHTREPKGEVAEAEPAAADPKDVSVGSKEETT